MKAIAKSWCVCSLMLVTAQQVEAKQTLFDFSNPNAAQQWQTVNDGVMGGRSDGRFQILQSGMMRFYGTLSLANNGGFASVRSRPRPLGLRRGDVIEVRLRGDGRKYSMNLYVPTRRTAYSYRMMFKTNRDEDVIVRFPVDRFVATSFGRVVRGAGPVDPADVTSIGFLLGDKKSGPFQMDIESISIVRVDER